MRARCSYIDTHTGIIYKDIEDVAQFLGLSRQQAYRKVREDKTSIKLHKKVAGATSLKIPPKPKLYRRHTIKDLYKK